MTDCLFCRIIARELPATIVYEDDRAVAFRDIHPQAPTHVLIVPHAHIATIDEIEEAHEADIGHLFRVASRVAGKEGLRPRGYRTVMNNGHEAGQSVFHVHLHLLGGKGMGWPPFPRG